MVDLAIGVIIGAAFGKIVDSLVKNIIMPLIGLILPGQQGYLGWKLVLDGKEVPFGLFLGDVVNFLIVALDPLDFHRQVPGVDHAEQKGRGGRPRATKDQELLIEIRDLLRKQSTATH